MTRTLRDWVVLFLKGLTMGAADAVPGVSGGTVAFITGIYEELLNSIRAITPGALLTLVRQGPGAFWQQINGSFLLVLLSGILLSLVSFARLAVYLLEHHPALLWAFFFGLILASSVWMIRQIEGWNPRLLLAMLVGVMVAFKLTLITPAQAEITSLTVFLAGAIAICAMILPGISGSFILLLLGMYAPIMGAIKGLELAVLGLFVSGCAIGLLSFSHLLSWMFRHYRQVTLALLTGFMIGSLNRVWPWKYTSSYRIDRHGEPVPLQQDNVLPSNYEALTGQDALLWAAVGLMLLGAVLVYILEAKTPSAGDKR
ncbi:DUF368 domain-containing protein [Motiliproteus sediminis]|uniref:DUF368 domain-containing protein n=1 Tax=Motiliproteus sediminis TaxID=1468178 RepID=UPI001AEF904D|nr:DUF368 domain-containing protein [Motiliproteus sediminis]